MGELKKEPFKNFLDVKREKNEKYPCGFYEIPPVFDDIASRIYESETCDEPKKNKNKCE